MIMQSLFSQGNELFSRGDFPGAVSLFTQALSHSPPPQQAATLLSNRSAALLRQDKAEEAERDAREAVRLRPGWAKARFRLAGALWRQRRRGREALQHAQAAVDGQPGERAYVELRDTIREAVLATTGSDEEDGTPKVTVLSGFLGAGKTTLMTRILLNREGARVAVLVNDMSEINIDAELLARGDVALTRGDEAFVELSNGCICCTLRGDLLREVMRLATHPTLRFDYILIESTGISEPLPVAQTFTFTDPDTGVRLHDVARLDTMVTVVDASTFAQTVGSSARLRDVGWHTTPQDERTLTDLLLDQVEFANVIVVNKCDLASPDALRFCERTVHALNPKARVIVTTRGENVPVLGVGGVLGSGLFDLEREATTPAWIRELGKVEHVPESEEFGISSIAFKDVGRGFHAALLEEKLFPPGGGSLLRDFNVIRSKGFCVVAQDDGFVVEWASAGPHQTLTVVGVPPSTPPHQQQPPQKSCTLVFIGVGLKVKELVDELHRCLVDDKPAWSATTTSGVVFTSCFQPWYTRLDASRARRRRMAELASLERDLTDAEMSEARVLAEEA